MILWYVSLFSKLLVISAKIAPKGEFLENIKAFLVQTEQEIVTAIKQYQFGLTPNIIKSYNPDVLYFPICKFPVVTLYFLI